jgi:hypothetical protein
MWLRTETSGKLLWQQQRKFEFSQMAVVSELPLEIAAFQGLRPTLTVTVRFYQISSFPRT